MSDSDIVQDFLAESYENLDRLDRELVGLEKNPHDRAALGSVFRTIHTIKGTCGFLGFNKLEKVAHVGESLLTRLRDGQLILNPELTTALLGMVDAVRQMLKEIQSTGQDGEIDYPELRETLTRLQQVGAVKPAELSAHRKALPSASKKRSKTAKLQPAAAATSDPPPELPKEELPLEANPTRVEQPVISRQEDVLEAQHPLESRACDKAAETIRVGVNVLDKLMTLVGELVLARNQLLQIANTVEDASFHAVSQRMNLIATELQEEVMKTRLQPIGNIWNHPANRPRRRPRLRQGSEHRDGRQRDGVGQDHHRGHQGSTHPSGAQLRGPWHRTSRSPHESWQGTKRTPDSARLS